MQGNEELKKRQILSAQIDLSKFYKGNGRREEAAGCHGRVNDIF